MRLTRKPGKAPDPEESNDVEAMPIAVWVIGFGIFAQGTSELMVAGILPDIAPDLDVSIPQAGMLISSFAFGMLLGAPALAALTLGWPRRPALCVFLAVFVATHVVSALTGSFGLLLAMRFLGAVAYSGFWAVGGSLAMAIAGPERRGQAMGIVAGGLTVATVLGLPGGTWVGQQLGWRGAFWVVAALAATALVLTIVAVPGPSRSSDASVGDEIRGLRPQRLWLSYAMTATATTALIATFSYLSSMLLETTGIAKAWVPVVLFGYGIGALIGIVLGGHTADRYPRAILGVGFVALVLTSAALAPTLTYSVPAAALAVALGFSGFLTNPALNSRVAALAPDAPTLAVACNVSAFNVGITLGPWLGGLLLSEGLGYPAIPTLGACIGAIALLLWMWDSRVDSR